MALLSKCPKCEKSNFELAEVSPKGAKFKSQFVQCSSCGTVVGVVPFHNTATILKKICDKLGIRLDL